MVTVKSIGDSGGDSGVDSGDDWSANAVGAFDGVGFGAGLGGDAWSTVKRTRFTVGFVLDARRKIDFLGWFGFIVTRRLIILPLLIIFSKSS